MFAAKQTKEDLRRIVIDDDRRRDVNVKLVLVIAVIATASSFTAVGAMVMMHALESYRQHVSAYWLSCSPFLFQIATGIYTGYKKQFGALGVHLSVTGLALLIGGLGFGSSITPIFLERENCTQANDHVSCNKESLIYLYIVFGAISFILAFFSITLTMCQCVLSDKRKRRRNHNDEIQQQKRDTERNRQVIITKAANIGFKPQMIVNSTTEKIIPAFSLPAKESTPEGETNLSYIKDDAIKREMTHF